MHARILYIFVIAFTVALTLGARDACMYSTDESGKPPELGDLDVQMTVFKGKWKAETESDVLPTLLHPLQSNYGYMDVTSDILEPGIASSDYKLIRGTLGLTDIYGNRIVFSISGSYFVPAGLISAFLVLSAEKSDDTARFNPVDHLFAKRVHSCSLKMEIHVSALPGGILPKIGNRSDITMRGRIASDSCGGFVLNFANLHPYLREKWIYFIPNEKALLVYFLLNILGFVLQVVAWVRKRSLIRRYGLGALEGESFTTHLWLLIVSLAYGVLNLYFALEILESATTLRGGKSLLFFVSGLLDFFIALVYQVGILFNIFSVKIKLPKVWQRVSRLPKAVHYFFIGYISVIEFFLLTLSFAALVYLNFHLEETSLLRQILLMFAYSFWIPQIAKNYTIKRVPLGSILGFPLLISVSRMLLPFYFLVIHVSVVFRMTTVKIFIFLALYTVLWLAILFFQRRLYLGGMSQLKVVKKKPRKKKGVPNPKKMPAK